MFRIALLVVHIAFAAVLFGAPLGLVGSCRRALAAGNEALRHAAADAARRGAIAGISSLGTLLTGIGLIFLSGGFGAVTRNYHVALTVMLVAFGVSAAIMRPNTAKLVEAARKDPVDRKGVEAALGRLGMGSGILQGLWLVILILMLHRF